MAERRPWRRLVENYTVVLILVRYFRSGVPQCGGMVERGCWPGDVGVARAGAMMCPGKSMQPRSVMSWATQGPPPSTCNPVASSRRASTFIALARSTSQQPASPTRFRFHPLTPHHALRVYPPPIGRRPQPGSLIPTLARHVAESTAGWTPRRLPVRTVQARAARYAHGCSICTWL